MAGNQVRTPYLTVKVDVVARSVFPAQWARETITLGRAVLLDMAVLIPPGHAGLTGFWLELEGGRVLPWGGTGVAIVGDNERLQYDLGLDVARDVDFVAYNLDTYDHSFYVTLHVDLLTGPEAPPGVLAVPIG